MKFVLFAAAATLSLCADATTSHAQTIDSYRHLVLDGHVLKWGEPALGTGAAVTFALVQSRRRFDEARNCGSMAPLDDLLSRNAISRDTFLRELEIALNAWEATANISFSPADPSVADILIGAQAEPRGYAFANVEYDGTAPGNGPRAISRSLVCFNPLRPWKIGFGGDLETYDLRYTLMHEIGHAIGLNHPLTAGQLMSHEYGERFRVLQAGDIRGAETLYGLRHGEAVVRGGETRQEQIGVERKAMSVDDSQALAPRKAEDIGESSDVTTPHSSTR